MQLNRIARIVLVVLLCNFPISYAHSVNCMITFNTNWSNVIFQKTTMSGQGFGTVSPSDPYCQSCSVITSARGKDCETFPIVGSPMGWQCDYRDASDGLQAETVTYEYYGTDENGDRVNLCDPAASNSFNFYLDSEEPSFTFTTPLEAEGTLFGVEDSIQGSATDNLAICSISADSTNLYSNIVIPQNGYRYSPGYNTQPFELTFENYSSGGPQSIKFRARDCAVGGANEKEQTVNIILDVNPPTIVVAPPSPDPSDPDLLQISGTAIDDAGVKSIKLQIIEQKRNKIWAENVWTSFASEDQYLVELDIPVKTEIPWSYSGLSYSKIGNSVYTIKAIAIDQFDRVGYSQPVSFSVLPGDKIEIAETGITKPAVIIKHDGKQISDFSLSYGQRLDPPLCVTTDPPGYESGIQRFRSPRGGFSSYITRSPTSSCSAGITVDVVSNIGKCVGFDEVQAIFEGETAASINGTSILPDAQYSAQITPVHLCQELGFSDCFVQQIYAITMENKTNNDLLTLRGVRADEEIVLSPRLDDISFRCKEVKEIVTGGVIFPQSRHEQHGWFIPDRHGFTHPVEKACNHNVVQTWKVGACRLPSANISMNLLPFEDARYALIGEGTSLPTVSQVFRRTLRTFRSDCRNKPSCSP